MTGKPNGEVAQQQREQTIQSLNVVATNLARLESSNRVSHADHAKDADERHKLLMEVFRVHAEVGNLNQERLTNSQNGEALVRALAVLLDRTGTRDVGKGEK